MSEGGQLLRLGALLKSLGLTLLGHYAPYFTPDAHGGGLSVHGIRIGGHELMPLSSSRLPSSDSELSAFVQCLSAILFWK